ncbi:MAG: DUF559 domain-containing protein [Actinomycetota bacterium]
MVFAQRTPGVTTSPDSICRHIAAQQFGILTRDQAREAGLSESSIWRRVRRGEWQRVFPAIYSTERIGDPWLKCLMAACLKAKIAAVSHRAAGAIWNLDGIVPGKLEITVPFASGGLRLAEFKIHRTRFMPPSDLSSHGRLPLTSSERTLVDLAAVVSAQALEAALDSALRKRITNLSRVRSCLDRIDNRPFRGIGSLRRLVKDRTAGASVTGSPLETTFLAIVRRAGLPEPRRQLWIRDGKRSVGRVDFAYPEAKLVIEIDSLEHHFGREAMQRDRRRDNELKRLGWTVLRFTAADLDEPEYVVRVLRSLVTPGLFP